uniref:Uncharacterized protein n=1 Tax=Setaria italica TaxID=4555 RepID=K3ZFP1_SETIT
MLCKKKNKDMISSTIPHKYPFSTVNNSEVRLYYMLCRSI